MDEIKIGLLPVVLSHFHWTRPRASCNDRADSLSHRHAGLEGKPCLMDLTPELFTPRCATPKDVSCLRADSGRMTMSAPRGFYTDAPHLIGRVLTLSSSLTEASFTAWSQTHRLHAGSPYLAGDAGWRTAHL